MSHPALHPFFPPRTGLQTEIDTLIESLVELRRRPACANHVYDDEATNLRALAVLATNAARAMDLFFQRIARDAGLTSDYGDSYYANLVSGFAIEELVGGIEARADGLEEDRAPVAGENEQHRLTGRQLGLRG